jgi:hypothetical protein
MKTKTIALFVMMVGLAVGAANGQSTEPATFRAPFAFVIGDQPVPAGEYTFSIVSVTGLLLVRSADGTVNVFINSLPIQKLETESRFKLVFHRYGAHYYVSEIWTPGYRRGRVMTQHPSELELAKSAAPQHVILYASAQAF